MKGRKAPQPFKPSQKEFVPPMWRVIELSNPFQNPSKRVCSTSVKGRGALQTFKTVVYLYEAAAVRAILTSSPQRPYRPKPFQINFVYPTPMEASTCRSNDKPFPSTTAEGRTDGDAWHGVQCKVLSNMASHISAGKLLCKSEVCQAEGTPLGKDPSYFGADICLICTGLTTHRHSLTPCPEQLFRSSV